jgi:hypothetical protein
VPSPSAPGRAARPERKVASTREGDGALRDIRPASNALEALKTKQHDLAEKMLLRFLS